LQKRLKNSFPCGDIADADKRIMELIGENGTDNSQKHRLMIKIVRDIVENELTERQRQMIGLYYYKRMNVTEIAEMLGVNRSTVSRTISRGRRNILVRMKYFVG